MLTNNKKELGTNHPEFKSPHHYIEITHVLLFGLLLLSIGLVISAIEIFRSPF